MQPHDVVFHARTLTLYVVVRLYDDGKAQLLCIDGYMELPTKELTIVNDTIIQAEFERRYSSLYAEWELPGNPISRVLG